jgi:hypothetical protein
MRRAERTAVAVAALVLFASTTGCSSASNSVEPELWRQVDAAEGVMYSVINNPSTALPSTPDALLDQLAIAATHWHGEEDAPSFAEDQGTSVFYNYRVAPGNDEVSFDVFVTSGIDEHVSVPGWLDSRPSRVYTCYRIELSFQAGALRNFHRSHDYGEDRLVCPLDLVSALGDGAQYREPQAFDG